MAFVTYDEIESLIDHAEQKLNSMVCYFKCPVSGKIIESTAGIPAAAGHEIKNQVAQGVWRHAMRQIQVVVRQLTGIHLPISGGGASGHFGQNSIASESSKREAIVLAFEHKAVYPGKEPRVGWFHHVDGQWVVYAG